MDDLTRERRKKLRDLRALGVEPYYYGFRRDARAANLVAGYEEGRRACVAGRVFTIRRHGKTGFCDLRDESGKIQLYVRLDTVGEEAYAVFRKVDIGDFLGAEGDLFKTKTGEISIRVEKLAILSKAIRPLPEKWHGLKDKELRYRYRYLDLLSNPDVREIFLKSSRTLRALRNHLESINFIEVESPVMQSLAGGAAAKPFVTHHNALDINLSLRIAPELFLKRLLVGGFERIYEMGRCFRNEGISTRHNPEFTILEVYQAYADYTDMMDLLESMISSVARHVNGTTALERGGREIELEPPWKRLPLFDAIETHAGISMESVDDDDRARELAREAGVEVEPWFGLGKVVDEILKTKVAPNLMDPTILYDYPVELSPLARRKPFTDRLVERFQAFVGGLEIANAFSELIDPIDQRERFEAQIESRKRGDAEAHPLDEDFLAALEHGMPPTGGLGVGIDRLVMLLTEQPSIRDVILFPQLRPENPS